MKQRIHIYVATIMFLIVVIPSCLFSQNTFVMKFSPRYSLGYLCTHGFFTDPIFTGNRTDAKNIVKTFPLPQPADENFMILRDYTAKDPKNAEVSIFYRVPYYHTWFRIYRQYGYEKGALLDVAFNSSKTAIIIKYTVNGKTEQELIPYNNYADNPRYATTYYDPYYRRRRLGIRLGFTALRIIFWRHHW